MGRIVKSCHFKMKVLILATILFVTAHSKFVPNPCPIGCDCKDFSTCNWSIHGADILAHTSENDSKWMEQAKKIRKYTCNDDMQAVCCCGPEQLAPDFEPLPTNFNRTVALDRGWLWDKIKAGGNAIKNGGKKVINGGKKVV